MANTSSSRTAVRNAPQPKAHQYIGALVSDDFGRMSTLKIDTAHTFAKKKLDTASQSLQMQVERKEKMARQTEAREYRAAERGLQAELREADQRARLLSRRIKTKIIPDGILRHKPPRERTRLWPYAATALPSYDRPVLDRRRERGVFMRVRYYSRRTAEQGVSQRVVKYVFNGAELDGYGDPDQYSNVGLTIDETLCAFDHLEQVNWSAAKNAKLLLHGIMAVDHRQTPDEMMRTGTRWAEESLGRFDLPYLVTLHAPPPDGDARNWHLHVLWSARPLVRTGDHEWDVGEMLRTDLDSPAAMKLMREMYAAVMTEVSFELGQNQIYTAKSNAARGLVHEPQVHLGAADANRARGGKYVAANEENHERVQRSKTAVLDDDLRHADETLMKRLDAASAIGARWSRLPSLPMRVPERIVAATISANLPKIPGVPARCPASITIPALAPSLRVKPTRMVKSLIPTGGTARGLPSAPSAIRPGLAIPSRRPDHIHLKIANLRFHPIPTAHSILGSDPLAPQARPVRSATISVPAVGGHRSARALVESAPGSNAPTVRGQVTLPVVPRLTVIAKPRAAPAAPAINIPQHLVIVPISLPVAPRSLPRFTGFDGIELTMRRAQDAQRRDEDRRDQEAAKTERVRLETAERAAEGQRLRLALHHLFTAIIEERHYIAAENYRRVVEPSLLARFGVSQEQISADHAQHDLKKIAHQQSGELIRIDSHLRDAPDQLCKDGDHWVLNENAPADVRNLVFAWRNEPRVQVALARIAATKPNQTDAHDTDKVIPNEEPGDAWRRAKQYRKRLMADRDEAERLDGTGISRPGEQMVGPGTPASVAPPRIRQRLPGMPGSGLGD